MNTMLINYHYKHSKRALCENHINRLSVFLLKSKFKKSVLHCSVKSRFVMCAFMYKYSLFICSFTLHCLPRNIFCFFNSLLNQFLCAIDYKADKVSLISCFQNREINGFSMLYCYCKMLCSAIHRFLASVTSIRQSL
ncbi:hypothetical protein SAMN05421690_1001185 [Nitrosomonas sp. Nm51]|nr:hypothetical protein SAMN05421690_1001185 [Nitrosomonas sp. Nm51]